MWAGIAGAAAILFAIAAGAYLYFTSAGPGGAGRSPIAQKQPDSKSDAPRTPQPRPEAPSDDPTPELIPPPRVEVVQNDEPKEPPREPGSQPKESRVVTTPPRDPKTDQIDKIDLRLPVMLPLRRLDEPDSARQLKEEISKDRGYRLELFCLDSSKAFAKLQAGFQAIGVQFVLEPEVQKIVGTRRKIPYVLFAEDLLPDEVFKLLQQLGVNDKKAEAHRTGEGQFGTLVVSRLVELDQKELGKLLGVEPKQLLPVKSKGPLGVDLRKPLPDQTADQLGRALAGQGGAKPSPGQPAARRALVLVHMPERPRSIPSKETKLFLDSRTTPRPGSLQIMLVLRCSLD